MNDRTQSPAPPACPPSPASDDQTLERELLRHYMKTADAKVAAIEDAIAQTRAQSGPAAASSGGAGEADPRRPLIRLLHTLAGNAGTYGFAPISTRARALERALIAENGAPYVEAGLDQDLDRFIAEMRAAFAEARKTLE